MESGTAVGIGVGLAALVVTGIVVAVTKKSAAAPAPPPPAPPPPPKPNAVAWTRTTQINPGDHVRVSVAQADVAPYAQAAGITNPDAMTTWVAVLALPPVQAALQPVGGNLNAWVGTQGLPADWPSDDTADATEDHVEFTYGGSVAISIASLPLPVTVWVAKGLGVNANKKQPILLHGGQTIAQQSPPPVAWVNVGGLVSFAPGARVRLSFSPGAWQSADQLHTYVTNAQYLAQMPVQGSSATVWAPGDPVPSDWPTNDPAVETEYRAEFVFDGAKPIPVSAIPQSFGLLHAWEAKV
jgi:hypothetical protein